MECLVGSIVHLDAESGFILTNKTFSSAFLAGSKAAKSFFFSRHSLSLYTNATFSTGEHNVALYIGILTIEIKYVSPGLCSWI